MINWPFKKIILNPLSQNGIRNLRIKPKIFVQFSFLKLFSFPEIHRKNWKWKNALSPQVLQSGVWLLALAQNISSRGLAFRSDPQELFTFRSTFYNSTSTLLLVGKNLDVNCSFLFHWKSFCHLKMAQTSILDTYFSFPFQWLVKQGNHGSAREKQQKLNRIGQNWNPCPSWNSIRKALFKDFTCPVGSTYPDWKLEWK